MSLPSSRPKGVHTKHLTDLERFRVRTLYYDAGMRKKNIQEVTGYTESQVRTAIRAKTAQVGVRSGRPKAGSKKNPGQSSSTQDMDMDPAQQDQNSFHEDSWMSTASEVTEATEPTSFVVSGQDTDMNVMQLAQPSPSKGSPMPTMSQAAVPNAVTGAPAQPTPGQGSHVYYTQQAQGQPHEYPLASTASRVMGGSSSQPTSYRVPGDYYTPQPQSPSHESPLVSTASKAMETPSQPTSYQDTTTRPSTSGPEVVPGPYPHNDPDTERGRSV